MELLAADSDQNGSSQVQKKDKLKKAATFVEGLQNRDETARVSLSFRNLTYTIQALPPDAGKQPPWKRKKKVPKTILNNVTAYAKAGQFLAVMGPSGS
jgi:ABC-type multidrug transport system fused ATPase/permease subunit